jgi:hypothetical protein
MTARMTTTSKQLLAVSVVAGSRSPLMVLGAATRAS